MRFLPLFMAILILGGASARADGVIGLPLDPSAFASGLIPQDVSNAIVKTVGIYTAQRPYQPATPLGRLAGLDIGIEATLVRIPDDFNAVLAKYGGGSLSSQEVPALPIGKLQIHKGFGDHVDIGGSWIGYESNSAWGLDLKVALNDPEEGPTWALRMCYSHSSISFVSTQSVAPEVLFSKKLEFADPYMGAGFQYIWGELDMTVNESDIPGAPTPPAGVTLPSVTITTHGTGYAAYLFTGVAMKVPELGFKITLEGSYNTGGGDTMGAKVGFEL